MAWRTSSATASAKRACTSWRTASTPSLNPTDSTTSSRATSGRSKHSWTNREMPRRSRAWWSWPVAASASTSCINPPPSWARTSRKQCSLDSTIRRRRFSIRASRRSCADGTATAALAGRQGARDDQALDLARALEQGVDLGVAVPFLDREVADVAVAAADLDRLLGDLDRHLAGLELGHRAFGPGELAAVAALPQRLPDQRPGGLDLGRHVGQHEGDRLVLDQGPAELLALLRVLQRELERRPRDAQRLGADDRARELERLQGRRRALVGALACPRDAGLELLDAAEHVLERDRAVLEQHLRRMRGADAHLLFLLAHAQALGARRDDERRLASGAQLGLHGGHDHVDVGDASVGDEHLLAVDDPAAVLADRARLHGGHVRPGVGLGDREGAEGGLVRRPVAGGDPGRDLVRRALGEDRGHGQAGALDGQRDAGAAPGQLLGDQRRHDPGAVAVGLLQELGAVESDLGRLLDDRPRKLFGLVVLVGDRPDLLLGEAVHPVADLFLLVAQLKRNHGRDRSPGCITPRYSYVPFPVEDVTRRGRDVSTAK